MSPLVIVLLYISLIARTEPFNSNVRLKRASNPTETQEIVARRQEHRDRTLAQSQGRNDEALELDSEESEALNEWTESFRKSQQEREYIEQQIEMARENAKKRLQDKWDKAKAEVKAREEEQKRLNQRHNPIKDDPYNRPPKKKENVTSTTTQETTTLSAKERRKAKREEMKARREKLREERLQKRLQKKKEREEKRRLKLQERQKKIEDRKRGKEDQLKKTLEEQSVPRAQPVQLPIGQERTEVPNSNQAENEAKFLSCCQKNPVITPSCYNICNFDALTPGSLADVYMRKTCPEAAYKPVLACATGGKDHRACCFNKIGNFRNGICLDLCYHGSMPHIGEKHFPCMFRLKHAVQCFREG